VPEGRRDSIGAERRRSFVASNVVKWNRMMAATLIASYEYEQTLSNDPLETYSVNTVSATVQWEF
jgi:hypothetical protein